MRNDATKKLPGEGFKHICPLLIKMDEATKKIFDAIVRETRWPESKQH